MSGSQNAENIGYVQILPWDATGRLYTPTGAVRVNFTGVDLSAASVTPTGGSATTLAALAAAVTSNIPSAYGELLGGSGYAGSAVAVAVGSNLVLNSGTLSVSGLGTMAAQSAGAVTITGGTINGTTVGATTPAAGAFTTLSSSGTATLGSLLSYQAAFDNTLPANTVLASASNLAPSSTCATPILFSGNISGTISSGGFSFLSSELNDSVNAAGIGGIQGHYIEHYVSGASTVQGGRTALQVGLTMATGTNNKGNFGSTYYNGFAVSAQASGNDGGTSGTAFGNLFAANPIVTLNSGATYWAVVQNTEFDIEVKSGASVAYKYGISIVLTANDAVAASAGDGAILIGRQSGGSSPGFTKGLIFGGSLGWWPIASSGTLITAQSGVGGGPSMAAAYGIDWSGVTFSSGFLKSTGFTVDGSGNTSVATLSSSGLHTVSGGESFGSQIASSTTDFSKHILLYSPGFGLNITSGRLNISVPASCDVVVVVNGTDIGTYSSTGLSVAGSVTPSQTAGIVGTTTNNNASSGAVGEFISSDITSGSAITLTTTTRGQSDEHLPDGRRLGRALRGVVQHRNGRRHQPAMRRQHEFWRGADRSRHRRAVPLASHVRGERERHPAIG